MAQFSQLVITKCGQDLLAKVLVDGGKLEFTRVAVSETEIVEENLEQLTELPEIKQESAILNIVKTSNSAVKVEASFSNRELTAGYFMRTLGLFAKDGENEVLYAAAAEVSGHCFMPPFNGVTASGALIQLVTAVGNVENISFEVDPAGTATIARVSEDIAKHNSDENAHAEVVGKISEKITADISAHNTNTAAHPAVSYQIKVIKDRMRAIEIAVGIEELANPFAVTFGNLDGITANAVWNADEARLEF